MEQYFYSKIGKEGGKKSAEIKRKKSLEKYYNNPKYCKYCGEVIEVKDNEAPSRTRQRIFCSSECHSKYQSEKMLENNIRKSELTYCINCGKELHSHQYKYCSNQCQNDFEYNDYITKWKNGLVDGLVGEFQLSNYIKKYIKEKYNNKCCKCGWDKINPVTKCSPLEIHHKDGNYKNNNEDNLELLCPNCHSLTENYKALNRSGRKERYQ